MTRLRIFVAIASLAALAACSDVTGPKQSCQVVGGPNVCGQG